MSDDIKKKTFNGVIWNFINTFGIQIVSIVPAMVLARLLTPAEYGLIALAGIFVGFVVMFSSCGFAGALIQRKIASQTDYNSVFYFNIFMSIIVYIIIYYAAPYCSLFFKEQEITNIMRISSIGIIIGSFGMVHNTIMRREMEFKKITIRTLSVNIISSAFAIILALNGFRYWAIIYQGLLQETMVVFINWNVCKWRPTRTFSFKSLKSLFNFSSKMLLTELMDYFFAKGYDISIGKFYSSSDLSYYNRAFSTSNLFIDSITKTINNVAFPAFSKMQDDITRMKNNLRRFLLIITFITLIIISILTPLATPLFHFFYSSKWDAVIPLFYITCFWGGIKPLKTVLENGLLSIGNATSYMVNNMINKILVVVMILLTWKYGIALMVFSQVITICIEVLFLSHFFKKSFSYSLLDIIHDVFPNVILSIIIGVLTYCEDCYFASSIANNIDNEFINSFIRLLLGGIFALTMIIILCKIYPVKAYIEIKDLLKDLFKSNDYAMKILKFI